MVETGEGRAGRPPPAGLALLIGDCHPIIRPIAISTYIAPEAGADESIHRPLGAVPVDDAPASACLGRQLEGD